MSENNDQKQNETNETDPKNGQKDNNEDKNKKTNSLSTKSDSKATSVRSSQSIEENSPKSISDDSERGSEPESDSARKELEKRQRLTDPKTKGYLKETTKDKPKSDVIIETITKELPKDMNSALYAINFSAGILSVVLLIVIWTQYFADDSESEETVHKMLITIAMGTSIVGQVLSWQAVVRKDILLLAISTLFLIIEAFTSLVVIIILIKSGKNLFKIFKTKGKHKFLIQFFQFPTVFR